MEHSRTMEYFVLLVSRLSQQSPAVMCAYILLLCNERQLRGTYHASTIKAVPDLTVQSRLCSSGFENARKRQLFNIQKCQIILAFQLGINLSIQRLSVYFTSGDYSVRLSDDLFKWSSKYCVAVSYTHLGLENSTIYGCMQIIVWFCLNLRLLSFAIEKNPETHRHTVTFRKMTFFYVLSVVESESAIISNTIFFAITILPFPYGTWK